MENKKKHVVYSPWIGQVWGNFRTRESCYICKGFVAQWYPEINEGHKIQIKISDRPSRNAVPFTIVDVNPRSGNVMEVNVAWGDESPSCTFIYYALGSLITEVSNKEGKKLYLSLYYKEVEQDDGE